MLYTEENFKNAKNDVVFDFICPNCGKKFTRSKRYISKNRGIVPKYCCHKCSSDAKNQGSKVVVCKECGKEYTISVHEYNRKVKEGSNFFCSRSCAAKYNNKTYPKRVASTAGTVCPKCGKKKNRYSELCNDCNKEKRENFVKNQELGYYIGYKKKKYVAAKCSEIRKDARRKLEKSQDIEKVCAYCHNHEFDSILEVHHIKNIMSFDPHTKIFEINNVSNLVWLCPNHHKMVECGMIEI